MKLVFLAGALSVLFWLAVAFTLVMALLPAPPASLLVAGDKVLHMAAFAVLSLLAALAFPRRSFFQLFAGLAALGGLIEILQAIPGLRRDAELADWLADCLAIAVALLACRALQWAFAPPPEPESEQASDI